MSHDKTTSAIGHLLGPEAQRDAVHFAVAPVIASCSLEAGQHIGLLSNGKATSKLQNAIGIVDPFLRCAVKPGERFWMFLYPQTVTGMRHSWSHPDFQDDKTEPASCEPSGKAASEAWLKVYVRKHCPYRETAPDGGYEEFLRHVERERWIYYIGEDCHSLGDVEDSDELFRHLSVVLGRHIDASYFEAFTCTC